MPYKTILVQLNDEQRIAETLQPAITLAARFGAHLIGLHVSPAMIYAPPLPGTGGVIGMIKEHERKVCDKIGTSFDEMTKGRGFVAEMRFLKPKGHDDVARLVVHHGRAVDLIVASQPAPMTDVNSAMDFPERLAMESGRPVLTIPLTGARGEIGRNVLLAWNGKREAARATFDALPLLKAAKSVTILGLEQIRTRGDNLSMPDTAIGASLARHDVNVTVKTGSVLEGSVGEEILARVAGEGADLLVMGAYGHMRLRELVFGGATRHVVRHMTVPTLLSH
jgi:nucleotide-binding universal stress UspA family protein